MRKYGAGVRPSRISVHFERSDNALSQKDFATIGRAPPRGRTKHRGDEDPPFRQKTRSCQRRDSDFSREVGRVARLRRRSIHVCRGMFYHRSLRNRGPRPHISKIPARSACSAPFTFVGCGADRKHFAPRCANLAFRDFL